MIEFKRDGTTIEVLIEVKASQEKRWLPFHWNANNELYAELLVENFKHHLIEQMQRARKEAYEAGWKDAKAKQQKETWFGGWL